MATDEESSFFPGLERCLDGDSKLLSWRSIFELLVESKDARKEDRLKLHLTDPRSLKLLCDYFEKPGKSTAESRSSFETITSAINITPTNRESYNIEEIKSDTIWLSKEASIDELAALRLVVLEWQSRSTFQLLDGYSADEDSILREGSSFVTTFWSSNASTARNHQHDHDNHLQHFASESGRHSRILNLYLSERQYLPKVCQQLLCVQCQGVIPEDWQPGDENETRREFEPTWLQDVGSEILASWYRTKNSDNRPWIAPAIILIQTRLEDLGGRSPFVKDADPLMDLEMAWSRTLLLEAYHIMEIILTLTVFDQRTIPSAQAVIKWFQFISALGFFEQLELPFPLVNNAFIQPFQSLVSLTSLALLKLPLVLESIEGMFDEAGPTPPGSEDTRYITHPSAFDEITNAMMECASMSSTIGSPAMLAWGIILEHVRNFAEASRESREMRSSQRAVDTYGASPSSDGEFQDRRASVGHDSVHVSFLEEVYEGVQKSALNDDVVRLLVGVAVDQIGVFDVMTSLSCRFCALAGTGTLGSLTDELRCLLLSLVRASLDGISYGSDIMDSTLAILQGDGTPSGPRNSILDAGFTPSRIFITDEQLMSRLFDISQSQYPLHLTPFVRLCRAICYDRSHAGQSLIAEKLRNLSSFTAVFSEDEENYSLVSQGDYNIELSRLLNVAPGGDLSASAGRLIEGGDTSGESTRPFQIPRGTLGRALNEAKPLVVLWNWKYSGLRYLGLVLRSSTNVDDIIEVIGLIAFLIVAPVDDERWKIERRERVLLILEELSDELDRNEDIIALIFSIFESHLHKSRFESSDGSHEILVRCAHFIVALLPQMPNRVWPFLARGSLLALSGQEDRLSVILSAVEIPSGEYPFLLACIRIFDAAIEDATSNVVLRQNMGRRGRFGPIVPEQAGTSITDQLMRETILSMHRILVDTFETMSNWKFSRLDERTEIMTLITEIMTKTLNYSYQIGDDSEFSGKLYGFLDPSATHLTGVFLSKSRNNLPIRPLISSIGAGLTTSISTVLTKTSLSLVHQTEASLRLCALLVRIHDPSKQPPTALEQQLFRSTPLLTKLFARHEAYRIPVLEILHALVTSAGKLQVQPPSLLSHIGRGPAATFLQVLSNSSGSLIGSDLTTSAWRFLTAIVSQRQQWFAIYLLTGETPKESLNMPCGKSEKKAATTRSILFLATELLCNLKAQPAVTNLALLEFLSTAADFWPWVVTDLRKSSPLLDAFTAFLDDLKSLENDSGLVSDSQTIRMASYIIDLLTMFVYESDPEARASFAKKLLPHLGYLIHHGTAQPAYNSSLHSSLRRNLEGKFLCNISHFKRTALETRPLGDQFYYDVEIAAKSLSHDLSWLGKANQGFANEFSRANHNLSLVDAQISLFHGWKALIVELSLALPVEVEVTKSLNMVIHGCLQSNLENTLPATIFTKLEQSRADLAFVLLQRVAELPQRGTGIQDILAITFDLFRGLNPDLGLALAGDGSEYTRTLLRIIYLALQIHSRELLKVSGSSTHLHQRKALATMQVVLEILDVVVAKGFRSLTTALHNDISNVIPADFVLINAILRCCLRMPGIERHAEYMMRLFSDDNTARYATTLLSWSDRLIVGDDPIFGDISIEFLLELSSLSALAECIAVGGISTEMTAANLLNYFRRPGGIGPFDRPARMYGMWTRGILPFVINILQAIGAPIASEMGTFLNQFSGQLSRVSANFDPKPSRSTQYLQAGYITLAMASEVQSLALISTILDLFREAGASAGIVAADVPELAWEKNQVKADIDSWLRRRGALRDIIMPANEKEESWSKKQPTSSQSGAENLLEEKVIDELRNALSLLGNGD